MYSYKFVQCSQEKIYSYLIFDNLLLNLKNLKFPFLTLYLIFTRNHLDLIVHLIRPISIYQ